jgi:hypothetical protein
MQALLVI